MTWIKNKYNIEDYHIYQSNNFINNFPDKINHTKIIGLGLERTIVKPSGLGFWISSLDNWTYCYDMSILMDYHNRGYYMVIFTNQLHLDKPGHLTLSEFKTLIETIDTNIPFQVFVSVKNSYYKKPITKIWESFLELNNISDLTINRQKSIFVGEEAGRICNSLNKKDNTSVDFYFSKNINFRFKTPEQFFQNSKSAKHMRLPISFNPKIYFEKYSDNYHSKLQQFNILPLQQHIILIIGSPASGKSRISTKYLSNHIRINQDTLKSVSKCFKYAKCELDKGNSIIIDNTNRNILIRSKWIELAKEYNIPIDCVYININRNMALHFNTFRNLNKSENKVPDIAIHTYYCRLTPPSQNEGFRHIVDLHYDSQFDDDCTKSLLFGYIRDKYNASYEI
jgi:bifunctional polynucleotide phosphatase/kinase